MHTFLWLTCRKRVAFSLNSRWQESHLNTLMIACYPYKEWVKLGFFILQKNLHFFFPRIFSLYWNVIPNLSKSISTSSMVWKNYTSTKNISPFLLEFFPSKKSSSTSFIYKSLNSNSVVLLLSTKVWIQIQIRSRFKIELEIQSN